MDDKEHAHGPKEPVTTRFDKDEKERLSRLAKEEGCTVSSLIQTAVKELLERRLHSAAATAPSGTLRVRHAPLPDTCVLRAFQVCAPRLFDQAVVDLNLPSLEFVENRPEWRRLPSDLYSGESDLIESMNLGPIYEHVTHGGSSSDLRLDWVGPFLQVFVGHCVFVREDFLRTYLDSSEFEDFKSFRALSRSGRDLSTRSLVAWIQASGENSKSRAGALETMWSDAVVGCQTGTDYHIAIRRVAPILASLNDGRPEGFQDPTISDVDHLDRGFHEFRSGAVDAFTGNLLHSATLLAEDPSMSVLLAGPADLRVPSLNTLAGRKGMFDLRTADSGSQTEPLGLRLLGLWSKAVAWFRDEVVNAETDEELQKLVESLFPDFQSQNADDVARVDGLQPISVLRSLMQSWVKWFSNPEDAYDFVGEPKEALSKHYARLCELLNPLKEMPAPKFEDRNERALWRFPTFPRQVRNRSTSSSPVTEVSGTSPDSKGATTSTASHDN